MMKGKTPVDEECTVKDTVRSTFHLNYLRLLLFELGFCIVSSIT